MVVLLFFFMYLVVCPKPTSFGICVESCPVGVLCGPGMKCCYNGCGHVCTKATDCAVSLLCEHNFICSKMCHVAQLKALVVETTQPCYLGAINDICDVDYQLIHNRNRTLLTI